MQATVLPMPWAVRVGAEARAMVREFARQAGVKPDSHLKWVPLLGFVLVLTTSVGAIIMSYGVWKGRDAAEKEAIADNQAATRALVLESEGRLIRAADELKQAGKDLEGRLTSQVGEIRGEVQGIRSSVEQRNLQFTGEIARLRAEMDSFREEARRLNDAIEVQELKRQRDERDRLRGQAQAPGSPPGG